MSEIDDLLKKLRPLDAPTYENITKWGLNWNHPDEAVLSEYIIQGEVQRAIAAKNWWLNLSTFTAIPSAKIQKPDDPVWRVHHGSGESLAVAILKAYISCPESPP